MKRLILVLLIFALLFSGCALRKTDVTVDEIVQAYRDADYSVWHRYYDEKLDHGGIGYIQANHPDGDYIYFAIFETAEEAQAYKNEYYHPYAIFVAGLIYGETFWPISEVYGNIVVEYNYFHSELVQPFNELVSIF